MTIADAIRVWIKILYSVIFPSASELKLCQQDEDDAASLLNDDAQLCCFTKMHNPKTPRYVSVSVDKVTNIW
jgi:hypothetical protein